MNFDEVIELPKFDFATITIEQMSILQDALAKKNQELLRQEHMQKQALIDINDISIDAFSLPTPEATKSIID